MFPNAPALPAPQRVYGGNRTQAAPSVEFGSLSLIDALNATYARDPAFQTRPITSAEGRQRFNLRIEVIITNGATVMSLC